MCWPSMAMGSLSLALLAFPAPPPWAGCPGGGPGGGIRDPPGSGGGGGVWPWRLVALDARGGGKEGRKKEDASPKDANVENQIRDKRTELIAFF